MAAFSWFSDPELVSANFTASHVCNNLSRSGETLVYVHLDDVIRVCIGQTPVVSHKIAMKEKSFVHQARICRLDDSEVIAVATDAGIQIYDALGEQLIFQLRLNDAIEVNEEGFALFCRGIAALNSEQPAIAVGTSLGKIFILAREKDAKASTSEFELAKTLLDHKSAICAMDSTRSGELLASGDEEGNIVIHSATNQFEPLHRMDGNGYPATSLRFTDDNWIIAGYLTGHLRLVQKDTYQIYAEITAHSRAITAVDFWNGYFVSVGEDTFMNVWEFSGSKSAPRIKLASSQCVPNDLLVGVACGEEKQIITSSYDTSHLKLWKPE